MVVIKKEKDIKGNKGEVYIHSNVNEKSAQSNQ